MDEKRDLINQLVGGTVRVAAFISGLALLWLMALTIVAVVTRYVFNAPILGAQDLSQISLVVVVFPAMAYCGWTGGHVALDFISSLMGRDISRRVDTIINTICGVLLLLVAWRTWTRAVDALQYGEASNLIEIPHAPFFFIISASSGLYALVLFVRAVNNQRDTTGDSR